MSTRYSFLTILAALVFSQAAGAQPSDDYAATAIIGTWAEPSNNYPETLWTFNRDNTVKSNNKSNSENLQWREIDGHIIITAVGDPREHKWKIDVHNGVNCKA